MTNGSLDRSKKIFLTQGLFTIVDDQDYDRLNRHKWHAAKSQYNGRYYARRSIWENGKSIHVYMHREILNCPKDKEVDHVDGTTLDNRHCNIQIVTKKENLEKRNFRKDKK